MGHSDLTGRRCGDVISLTSHGNIIGVDSKYVYLWEVLMDFLIYLLLVALTRLPECSLQWLSFVY